MLVGSAADLSPLERVTRSGDGLSSGAEEDQAYHHGTLPPFPARRFVPPLGLESPPPIL